MGFRHVSHTALKVGLVLITLNQKSGWKERLPEGLARLTERLLLAANVFGYGRHAIAMAKHSWAVRLSESSEKRVPGVFEGIGRRKLFMESHVLAAIEGGAVQVLVLGAGFVAGGEYIRRRWGDRPEVATAFLPSVFSGAGLVVLFGSVLAALHLYQLISPTVALIGLVAVAGLGIGLGWYSGPLLAALGILGAFATPFVVGGESDAPELFYGYFGLVAVVGLAIDAGRRRPRPVGSPDSASVPARPECRHGPAAACRHPPGLA